MILPMAFFLGASCAQSEPCRTVDAYLRALKAFDPDRLEPLVDPAFRRADGSHTPFDPERNRAHREFERGTRTRWKYSILGIDGERISVLESEDNDFYRLLGVGVRTQIVEYGARNGRVYFAESKVLVDENGVYIRAYRDFATWLRRQPAASDPEVMKDGDLVFSIASAPKILGWLRKYRQSRKEPT